jgi:hypothetical protein
MFMNPDGPSIEYWRISNAVSATKLISVGAPGGAINGLGPRIMRLMVSVAVRVLPQPRPVMIIQTNQSPAGIC